MSAIKKHNLPLQDDQAEEENVSSTGAQLEDVSGKNGVEGADSPAKAMQDHLHKSINSTPRKGAVMDVGRVLAAASGITLILGVFMINGIW